MNDARIQGLIAALLREIEPVPSGELREGLQDTPARVSRSFAELFGGYDTTPAHLLTTFHHPSDQIIAVCNIEFYSTCEHHVLPFYGLAHVGYLVGDRLLGISKMARLVECFARRLQIQERIGAQVVDALMDTAKAKGAGCVLEAKHLCMMARGVAKQRSVAVTSALRGEFLAPSVKDEFLRIIQLSRSSSQGI